ncbi:MAG: hypothetical protein QM635_10915 [Microbacteriaceae bacterium]
MMVAYRDLAPVDVPQAAMLTRITQQIGASFGVAVVAVALHSLATGGDLLTAFRGAFWWTNVIAALAILPTLALRGARADTGEQAGRGNGGHDEQAA